MHKAGMPKMSDSRFSIGDRVQHKVSKRIGQVVGKHKSQRVQVKFDGDSSYMEVRADLLEKVTQ